MPFGFGQVFFRIQISTSVENLFLTLIILRTGHRKICRHARPNGFSCFLPLFGRGNPSQPGWVHVWRMRFCAQKKKNLCNCTPWRRNSVEVEEYQVLNCEHFVATQTHRIARDFHNFRRDSLTITRYDRSRLLLFSKCFRNF